MKTLILFLTLCVPALGALKLETLISDLDSPVFVGPAPGDSGLYVIEQDGRILRWDGRKKSVFLDIREQVKSGGERGLLGLAFHPKYASNGRYFVNYTFSQRGLMTRVDERQRDKKATRREVLSFSQPYGNHNGGHLEFGPDGKLYIGIGDGGGAGDTQQMGQNRNSWLGTVLRIDVDGAKPYAVPADNPFVGKSGKPEIWAWGLRNPWRFSFDPKTGALLLADVGQNRWEEINVIRRGGNYGWNTMEGKHCYPPGSSCDSKGLTLPILQYGRGEGVSVTGGVVYRGTIPSLQGKYIYGDYQSGKIWALDWSGKPRKNQLLLDTNQLLSSFGVDTRGELLVVNHGGTVSRLVEMRD